MTSSTFEGQDGGQVTIYPGFIRRCTFSLWENVEEITKSNNILRKLVEVLYESKGRAVRNSNHRAIPDS